MPSGYWWQCESCGANRSFREVTKSNSTAAFIWDELAPAAWDQRLLVQPCPECDAHALRITYEFPRKNRVLLHVHHIVGKLPEEGKYVPMMWETQPSSDPGNRWIDFKYIIGRNNRGLNKPPVFTEASFRTLLSEYRARTGKPLAV